MFQETSARAIEGRKGNQIHDLERGYGARFRGSKSREICSAKPGKLGTRPPLVSTHDVVVKRLRILRESYLTLA